MLMQLDGTIIFVIISFLIFLFIIKTILLAPISKVIEERNNFYAKNSKMESESKEKSKALFEQKESMLNEARIKASDILTNVGEEAKKQSESSLKEAKNEALKKVSEQSEALDYERQNVKNEIKSEVSNITQAIISKVLGEKIQINLEEEDIKRYLKI